MHTDTRHFRAADRDLRTFFLEMQKSATTNISSVLPPPPRSVPYFSLLLGKRHDFFSVKIDELFLQTRVSISFQ